MQLHARALAERFFQQLAQRALRERVRAAVAAQKFL
jgi:hypothetical protein